MLFLACTTRYVLFRLHRRGRATEVVNERDLLTILHRRDATTS